MNRDYPALWELWQFIATLSEADIRTEQGELSPSERFSFLQASETEVKIEILKVA